MHPEDLARPSWACVHFVTVEEAAAARAEFAGRPGFTLAALTAALDAAALESAESADAALLDAVAAALGFPSYFGRNWDALDECLRDLGRPDDPGAGIALLVEGAAELWAQAPRAAGRLVESWLFSAEEQARDGVALHLLFVL